MRVLENEAFGCAETVDIGIWMRLMRYCCVQENSGRIRGAKEWDDRKWMHLCSLQKAEVARKSDLWAWRGHELFVHHFPAKSLSTVRRLRRQSADANKSRWGNKAPNREQESVPHGIPSGTAKGTPDSASGDSGIKDKDKGRIKKRKGRGTVPSGTAENPPSRAEVLSFFALHGCPESQATKFFVHYTANGWVQGNGQAIADPWSQAEKWIGDWRERENQPQNSSAGAAPFDGSQPHAHTQGIALEN